MENQHKLFDVTEFTVKNKENPLKNIYIPDEWIVIYLNTVNTWHIKSFSSQKDAVFFCLSKYPVSLLACRIIRSKELFECNL